MRRKNPNFDFNQSYLGSPLTKPHQHHTTPAPNPPLQNETKYVQKYRFPAKQQLPKRHCDFSRISQNLGPPTAWYQKQKCALTQNTQPPAVWADNRTNAVLGKQRGGFRNFPRTPTGSFKHAHTPPPTYICAPPRRTHLRKPHHSTPPTKKVTPEKLAFSLLFSYTFQSFQIYNFFLIYHPLPNAQLIPCEGFARGPLRGPRSIRTYNLYSAQLLAGKLTAVPVN